MRRKQLFAIILAGALAAGSAPAAVFAAESDMAAMSEEGVGNAGSEEAGSEDGSSDAEAPVTDGADAADAATDTPAADNTTTDETPAADNTGAAETPAAEDPATADTTLPEEVQTQEQTEENKEVDPQEGENPVEATGIEVLDADGQEIFNTDGKRFENLQDAINAVPDYEESAENKPIIKISQSIVLTDTITINGKKVRIQSTANGVTIKRNTEGEAFTGTMFSVTGENSRLQFFIDDATDATLTVSGELPANGVIEAEATGAIIDVQSGGTFGLNSGVTLTGNNYAEGGSAINCTGGKIVLAGGTVTNNDSGDKGAVYSDTDISMEGDASVSGNVDNKNIYLGENAKLTLTKVTSVLTGQSTFTHIKAQDGLGVIAGTTDMTKDEFATAIKNITYDDTTNYEYSIGSDGYSVALKKKSSGGKDDQDKPTDYEITYKAGSAKWRDHTTVEAKFTVTGDCEWAYVVVKKGTTKVSPKKLSKFTSAKKNTSFTVVAENVPEEDSKIIVVARRNSSDTDYKQAKPVYLYTSAMKKARPAKPQATATIRPASTPKVTEGTVTGFEDSIKFFPGKVYTFTPTGAGQDNQNPVTGDERWIPQYWTFSTSNDAEKHTKWQISAPKGQQLKGKGSVTYTIYIYCKKQVYNGKKWVDTDVVQPYKSQFTAVEYTDKELADYLAELSGTPAQDDADGGDGGDGSGGDGGTDAELTATAAASAKDAGSKSKSAVSTADESPIGTMSVLAALSLLAGGYVVVRKRKKEEI
ncbi:Uncharacterised protein [uncultured Ruminococcus sp.]|nr:Uncharacterised protein [uncultured Ruminococcus sp.]